MWLHLEYTCTVQEVKTENIGLPTERSRIFNGTQISNLAKFSPVPILGTRFDF
jgi:hypothetical protein